MNSRLGFWSSSNFTLSVQDAGIQCVADEQRERRQPPPGGGGGPGALQNFSRFDIGEYRASRRLSFGAGANFANFTNPALSLCRMIPGLQVACKSPASSVRGRGEPGTASGGGGGLGIQHNRSMIGCLAEHSRFSYV